MIGTVKEWEKDGVKLQILDCHGHYCGYATFKKRPLREEGYKGIATYVPVHGGITFAEQEQEGFRYGFDCAHAGDEGNPKMRDLDYLSKECEIMADCLVLASKYEKKYLLAKTNKTKAKIIDDYHKKCHAKCGTDFLVADNFGTMINVLCGSL